MSKSAWPAGTDALLADILTDAYGDDEQLWALRQAFEDSVRLPAPAFVLGQPVSVRAIDYDGNDRRGLTARIRRADGSVHVLPASEISFPDQSAGARHVAAYRKWLGIVPLPAAKAAPPGRTQPQETSPEAHAKDTVIELIVLAPKERAVRCRIPGTANEVTLRTSGVWNAVPGEIVTVRVRRQWSYAGHAYLAGDVEGHRLDASALGLVPLELRDEGRWDPEEEYWGEEDEPLAEWARPIVAHGPRPAFEMEQVLPGQDPEDWDSDPIIEASELSQAGDRRGARKLLLELLAADLRCLDAHAHLGNIAFDRDPAKAIRHYEAGVRIGELSLGNAFDGLLPWSRIDNRPFLRCLHGFGLALWRLGRRREAAAVFERMLWLNPMDNQGIRFLLPPMRAGEAWTGEEGGQADWSAGGP